LFNHRLVKIKGDSQTKMLLSIELAISRPYTIRNVNEVRIKEQRRGYPSCAQRAFIASQSSLWKEKKRKEKKRKEKKTETKTKNPRRKNSPSHHTTPTLVPSPYSPP
jgi:hypothetical protein